jgi:hypothetical protein
VSNDNKGIVHLLILVTIAAIAIGTLGYYTYNNLQTEKETRTKQTTVIPTAIYKPLANNYDLTWKTYTNTEFGYTISYPESSDGVIIEESDNAVQFYRKTPKGPFATQEFPGLQVKIIENISDKSGVNWIAEESEIKELLKQSQYEGIRWNNSGNWYLSSDSIATFGYENYAYGFFENTVVKITTTYPNEELSRVVSSFEFTDSNL